MSFGFSLGDFVAIGELAYKLYRDCYKVARNAPNEVQLLTDELKTLSGSLAILQDEAKDPDSILVQAGADRVQMVNDMVQGIGNTLHKLEDAAKKYGILVSSSKRKHLWTKLKWSLELSSIDALRAKLIYHNTCMNLLLTSVGNSSLQRLESSNRALAKDVGEIKCLMFAAKAQQDNAVLSISAIDNDLEQASLSAAFMKNAEVSQSWRTISLDLWIEAGRWWLLKSQMGIYNNSAAKQILPIAAYTDLLKASWILVDIIGSHPQTPFATASTMAEVRSLSTQIRRLFSELLKGSDNVPELGELIQQDLRIWVSSTGTSLLKPRRGGSSGDWMVESGEHVLYQQFLTCRTELRTEAQPSILLLLVQPDARNARLVAQGQGGSVLMNISFKEESLDLEETLVPNINVSGEDRDADVYSDNDDGNMDEGFQTINVKGKDLIFPINGDVNLFRCVVEGINAYLHGRRADYNNLYDLKAFILLTAVKNNCRSVTITLLERSEAVLSRASLEGDLPAVACMLASKYLEGSLTMLRAHDFAILCNRVNWKMKYDNQPHMSLFSWAILIQALPLITIFQREKLLSDRGELTPLVLAAGLGEVSIIQLLLAGGADIEETNDIWGSQNALHTASTMGEKEVVKLLLDSGANANAKTSSFPQPLHQAAKYGHLEIIQLLLDGGAYINARDYRDDTPLMQACSQRPDLNVVKFLLERGADLTATDDAQLTALDMAVRYDYTEVIQLLVKHNAPVECAKDFSGNPYGKGKSQADSKESGEVA